MNKQLMGKEGWDEETLSDESDTVFRHVIKMCDCLQNFNSKKNLI